jgi:phenylalanyl-tRNA synthetase beta chain
MALAGVIGGAATEIGPTTRHVLIEAAHFDPRSVRSTRRRLGLATDASYRFERGVDPQAPPAAQALAAHLLNELADGSPEPNIVDSYPGEAPRRRLTLRMTEVRRLLGFQPDPSVAADALDALQLSPVSTGDGSLCVTVPSWRADLEREADLVEEVARHLGYDRIPSTTDLEIEPAPESTEASLEERARDTLSHLGFHESLGYSMIGSQEDDPFVVDDIRAPLALVNPIAEPLAVLRRSIVPGLVRAVDLNLRRGSRDVRLFEVGRVFHASQGAESPDEPLRLALAWSGCAEPRHWSRIERNVDLYDVIGVGEHLLDTLRGGHEWVRGEPTLAALHPGRSLLWSAPDGRDVAWAGALHPEIQQRLDHEVFVLEVALDTLAEQPAEVARQRAVPRVPAVTRDLSLLLRGEVAFATLLETLRAVEPPAPARFEALDRYHGAPLADGETSLTVRITLEPLEHTLTDAETERYREALVTRLQETLGVRLRT